MVYKTASNTAMVSTTRMHGFSWLYGCYTLYVLTVIEVMRALIGQCVIDALLVYVLLTGYVVKSGSYGMLSNDKTSNRVMIGGTDTRNSARTTNNTIIREFLRITVCVLLVVVQGLACFNGRAASVITGTTVIDTILLLIYADRSVTNANLYNKVFYAIIRVITCTHTIRKAFAEVTIVSAFIVNDRPLNSICFNCTIMNICLLSFSVCTPFFYRTFVFDDNTRCFSRHVLTICTLFIVLMHKQLRCIIMHILIALCVFLKMIISKSVLTFYLKDALNESIEYVADRCINEQAKNGSRTFFDIEIKRNLCIDNMSVNDKVTISTNNFETGRSTNDPKDTECPIHIISNVFNRCLKEPRDECIIVTNEENECVMPVINDCTRIDAMRIVECNGGGMIHSKIENNTCVGKDEWVTRLVCLVGLIIRCLHERTRKGMHGIDTTEVSSALHVHERTRKGMHGIDLTEVSSALHVPNNTRKGMHGIDLTEVSSALHVHERTRKGMHGINTTKVSSALHVLNNKKMNIPPNINKSHDCTRERTDAVRKYRINIKRRNKDEEQEIRDKQQHTRIMHNHNTKRKGVILSCINILILSLLIPSLSAHYIMHDNFYLHAINRKIVLSRDRTSFKIENHGIFSKLRVQDLYVNEHMRLNTKGSHFLIERVVKREKDSSTNPPKRKGKEYHFVLRRKSRCLNVCGNELRLSEKCAVFRFGTADCCDFDFVRMFREGVFVRPFSDALVFIKKMTNCVNDTGLNGCGIS